ncbi:ubiquitin carboxyl-terminal hydrolase [Anaeramoeba flamelloides]|uniref:Ubiquitin carboxyl-terminal hydrolase n=1 Tax=Anaeramoeba flamelloides TaxID=1746091 RepID=A0AAV8ABQ5_9EUKA|nr:ubiquitin carboxyl-terminal hydrolase [Anaeramoeba flamelloides]
MKHKIFGIKEHGASNKKITNFFEKDTTQIEFQKQLEKEKEKEKKIQKHVKKQNQPQKQGLFQNRSALVPIKYEGLRNLGNTCYLNSSLQSLFACSALRSYLLTCDYDYETKLIKEDYLLELIKILKKIDQNPQSSQKISPKDFLVSVGSKNEILLSFRQQDASEFLLFLLDLLHETLKKKVKKDGLKEEKSSIVSDLFCGSLKNNFQCLCCETEIFTYENFILLPLPIPTDTQKNYNNNNNNNKNNKNKNDNNNNHNNNKNNTNKIASNVRKNKNKNKKRNEKKRKNENRNGNENGNENGNRKKNKGQDTNKNMNNNNDLTNSTPNKKKTGSISTDKISFFEINLHLFFTCLKIFFWIISTCLKIFKWIFVNPFLVFFQFISFLSKILSDDYFNNDHFIDFFKTEPKEPILLSDCFESFLTGNILENENEVYCSFCQKKTLTIQKFEFKHLPEYLIIHLKRFKYNLNKSSKIDRKIIFPISLDMSQYCNNNFQANENKNTNRNNHTNISEREREKEREKGKGKEKEKERGKGKEIQKEKGKGKEQEKDKTKEQEKEKEKTNHDQSSTYHLIAVIQHIGVSINSGHYIAYCKDHLNQWYKINDSVITKITEKKVLKKEAYLLIYQKNIPKSIHALQQQLKNHFIENLQFQKKNQEEKSQMFAIERLWLHMSLIISNPYQIPFHYLSCIHNNLTSNKKIYFKIDSSFDKFLSLNFKQYRSVPILKRCKKCIQVKEHLVQFQNEKNNCLIDFKESKNGHCSGYVVESKWIKKWLHFLQGGQPPGFINNSLLLEKDHLSLKKNLQIETDYYLFNQQIWSFFIKSFNSDFSIQIKYKKKKKFN